MCLFTCRVIPVIHCLITAILPTQWYSNYYSSFTQEESAAELKGWSEISEVWVGMNLSGDLWIFSSVFTIFTSPFLRGCNDADYFSPLFLSGNISFLVGSSLKLNPWLNNGWGLLTLNELVFISILRMAGWGMTPFFYTLLVNAFRSFLFLISSLQYKITYISTFMDFSYVHNILT